MVKRQADSERNKKNFFFKKEKIQENLKIYKIGGILRGSHIETALKS